MRNILEVIRFVKHNFLQNESYQKNNVRLPPFQPFFFWNARLRNNSFQSSRFECSLSMEGNAYLPKSFSISSDIIKMASSRMVELKAMFF